MADVSLQSIFDEARQALDSGDADLAIGIAQHILNHAPSVIEGHRLLGEAYLNANQPQQAVAAFEVALRADPENIAAYYALGLAQQSLGRAQEAIEAFERALEIQPNLAELRTQLLSLYAETPGSAGQFRLSRSGLGRLYARGQMYPQAVDEFRAVLEDEPDRDDIRVALAETYWRDGQEDEAMEWCRETVQRRPELFKPTLILGYLQLANGQPEGEDLWRRAASQEPTLQTAHALFEILPSVHLEPPTLPAFDPQAWHDERERLAATRQVEAAASAAPVADDAAVVASVAEQPAFAPLPADEGLSDDDLLARLLGFDLDNAPEAAQPNTSVAGASPAAPATDAGADLLAPTAPQRPVQVYDAPSSIRAGSAQNTSELATDAQAAPQAEPVVLEGRAGWSDRAGGSVDVDEPGSEAQPFHLEEERGGRSPTAMGRVEPFSLADWNFETEEEAPSEPAAEAETAPDRAALDEIFGDVKPFTPAAGTASQEESGAPAAWNDDLADLQWTSRQEDLQAAALAAEVAPDRREPLPELSPTQDPAAREDDEPFSFATLGLSDDEFADLRLDETPPEQSAAASRPAAEPGTSTEEEIAPFSLADLGLGDEAVEWEAESKVDLSDEAEEQPPPAAFQNGYETTPFSLDALGLTDEELEANEGGEVRKIPAEGEPPVAFYGFDAGDATPIGGAPPSSMATPGADEEEWPFSLADLDLTEDELAALEEASASGPDEPYQPPSLHDAETLPFQVPDVGLDEQAAAAATPGSATEMGDGAEIPELPAADLRVDEQERPAESADVIPFELRRYYEQIAAQPDNHGLRLALARVSDQAGHIEHALEQYRVLIKQNALVVPVIEDLEEMISGSYDRALLRRIHRLLGDAYMQQNRLEEAMDEYSWTG